MGHTSVEQRIQTSRYEYMISLLSNNVCNINTSHVEKCCNVQADMSFKRHVLLYDS